MNQKAQANEKSTVIQIAGNLTQGISFADCERLFNLLLTENFPRLEAIAISKAKENVDALVKATFEKIDSKIDQISVEKLAQPDVQSTFNNAVQGAARKGTKIDIDLLAELLESRIEKDSTDYIDNCIEAAVKMVPKLTSDMLAILPALYFIQSLTYNDPDKIDSIYGSIYDHFLSRGIGMSLSKLKTMASIGVGSYMSIVGSSTFEDMKEKYTYLQSIDSESKYPRMYQALNFYDEMNLHRLTLTTPGQVIAIKMLAKIFPSMSLRDFLE
ncbi:LPO_1073/Vpar_1526 family protein [Providencia alcalifaciens]|uniref:DUF4393 domain-containing protein n=1 Tax=Providencia alcalifaciens TaxID=126385 RepID=A0AAW9V9X2_9GAMM|nr:LPO_1073/Vpar_1526 family protein [Providencia alcalifaciens]EKT65953.1 hypothetical protein OO9_08231 [Providencia alcalifaciens Dmel2]MTC34401.1 hypothetical protein [Providencia alcalifaciens]